MAAATICDGARGMYDRLEPDVRPSLNVTYYTFIFFRAKPRRPTPSCFDSVRVT